MILLFNISPSFVVHTGMYQDILGHTSGTHHYTTNLSLYIHLHMHMYHMYEHIYVSSNLISKTLHTGLKPTTLRINYIPLCWGIIKLQPSTPQRCLHTYNINIAFSSTMILFFSVSAPEGWYWMNCAVAAKPTPCHDITCRPSLDLDWISWCPGSHSS